MRVTILMVAAASLCWASPALACRGTFSETHAFLAEVPEEVPEDAIVLRVQPQASITGGRNWLLVNVVEVVQGEWTLPTAMIDYGPETSCTRIHLPMEGAFVVGRRGTVSPAMLMATQYGMRGPLDWPYETEGQ